ncbi:putative WRKY transcription factor 70 [Prunus yedoensis var. nudiflora]|uniref:Putative WRKY transcription factor 70 n=1 Tax=Prunus yedoensis var. nudiflora TaxID=2094558 RepID=A0A314ULN5_PRUYE|nr:putative WRKY transcription factor 70 [Prunus yedoensis var. nudiflora]
MEWSWLESVLSSGERVKEELMQGACFGGGGGSAEGLVDKILGSFANALLILNGKESDDQKLVSGDQIQGISSGGGSADSSSWDANHTAAVIKSEDFDEESCKSASTFKDRRGSYKRRKTSHSWTRDTLTLTDDGLGWRKYGQKRILNSKHSRNYYRCTHKFEHSCKATKYVQQIQDHPPMFRTTYHDNHTCRDYLKASELVLDCTSPRESSKFIRFGDTKQDHPFFSSFTSVRKEELVFKEESIIKEEKPPTSDDHVMTSHDNHSWLCDYLVSPDLTTFESSGPPSRFSSTLDEFDHEDVISRLMIGSFDLDEVLQYI